MKLKRIAAGISMILLLSLGWYFWHRYKMQNQTVGLQPMIIMVEGTQYWCFDQRLPEKPEGTPDGRVLRVNAAGDYPDEDGEANFGTVGMPYWKVPLGICVYSNEEYILLRD